MEDGTYRVQGTTSLEDLSEALDYPFESCRSGSALALTYVPGRRHQLPVLDDPKS